MKQNKIMVQNIDITLTKINNEDFISLTDIARSKNSDEPKDVVKNWLRNKNTIEFLGLWETINNESFKGVEFDYFKSQAGSNSFTLSPTKWTESTNAIGLKTKAGRNGGTFAHVDIAFEFASWISAEFKLFLIKEFQTKPNSVYGKTKLDGENEMINVNPKNSIIIRTSWVYSSYGNNFVKTMLKLAKEKDELNVIFDQIGTPTYAKHLAKTILDIIPKLGTANSFGADNVQIYNYSNEGVLSWYDFAKEIMKMAKLNCKINPIETHQYPTPAKRPHYSLLNKSKIKSTFNIEIPYWKDGLDECLRKIGERK